MSGQGPIRRWSSSQLIAEHNDVRIGTKPNFVGIAAQIRAGRRPSRKEAEVRRHRSSEPSMTTSERGRSRLSSASRLSAEQNDNRAGKKPKFVGIAAQIRYGGLPSREEAKVRRHRGSDPRWRTSEQGRSQNSSASRLRSEMEDFRAGKKPKFVGIAAQIREGGLPSSDKAEFRRHRSSESSRRLPGMGVAEVRRHRSLEPSRRLPGMGVAEVRRHRSLEPSWMTSEQGRSRSSPASRVRAEQDELSPTYTVFRIY